MNLAKLPTYDANGHVQVVVETPRGSRAKFGYDPESKIFRFSRPMVLGVTYPYDWGFIGSTLADDGDPLDAMIYHDGVGFPGLVIACKPIGVVKLSQEDDGERQSNDRIIVVPSHEKRWDDATKLEVRIRQELEQFFLLATLMTAKKAQIKGWKGPEDARKLVAAARQKYLDKEESA